MKSDVTILTAETSAINSPLEVGTLNSRLDGRSAIKVFQKLALVSAIKYLEQAVSSVFCNSAEGFI